jgi:ribosomal protein S21
MSKNKTYNFKVTLNEVRGDPIRLIKRFIKKTKKSGILEECRERMFYEKPSNKRRRKKKRKIFNKNKQKN